MAREAVIVESKRTGLTKANRGSFNITEPVDYLAHTLRSVAEAVPNLDTGDVEDVIVGSGFPEGCQGMNVARIAAMAAGFPKEVAATTVNRFCSSGSQAVMMAAHEILNEGADVAIGAGVETITMMQDGSQNTPRLANTTARERFPGLYFPMGITAEIVAERYKVSREDQDAYALKSQQRYAEAVEKGYIAEEIVPMTEEQIENWLEEEALAKQPRRGPPTYRSKKKKTLSKVNLKPISLINGFFITIKQNIH